MYVLSLNKTAFALSNWSAQAEATNLVAVDTHVMGGDEGLEDDHPAGVGGSLEQRVSHLRDVHVGGIGGRHQVCNTDSHTDTPHHILLHQSL